MIGFLIQSPIEYYALKTPHHPALSYKGEELSYAELDRRSNQLAHALIAGGAGHQERIAVFMHKSIELAIAIYGILKAGCIFVPIDPAMPVPRLSLVLGDCGIRHAVSSNMLAKSLLKASSGDIRVYGVDNVNMTAASDGIFSWSEIYKSPDTRPSTTLTDQDLGYIMYTSGSTGVPKGMTHSHHGSISYARWGARHVALSAADRVASHAPLHFDLSIFDFFSTAQAGATVVLVPEATKQFPASWTQYIESEKISVVFTVPYTLIAMMEQGAMAERNLKSLRWILYGGEVFPPAKLRQLMLELPDVRFTNVYGPAEAPSCTCFDVTMPSEGCNNPIPIGLLSENSAGIVVDENDQDCSNGESGELCIRSSTLTRGYWNRQVLNQNAYLIRAGLGYFPQVFYRTGDRVRRDASGVLHLLGRMDRMVKVRGQRVELDEIESVLTAHPSVFEAAAIAIPDDHDSQQIIAVVACREGECVDRSDLLTYAREHLPVYAIPAELAFEASLPHNSSGKIDRKKLSEQLLSNQSQ